MTDQTPDAALSAPLPLHHPAALLATWFGAGLSPFAPGTVGSAAALPFAVFIEYMIPGLWGQIALAVAALIVFLVGIWAGGRYARSLGRSDPGAVVIDEVSAQFLTLSFVPLGPIVIVLGFFLFRLADIVKPWPANWADRKIKGGLGIMLDDLFAGLYAGAVLWMLNRWMI